MECPACRRSLLQMKVGDLSVESCNGGCGGVWFDRFELDKIDAHSEHMGEGLLNVPVDPKVKVDHQQRRNCPKCKTIVMMRHFYSPRKEAEVDECPSCAGFWLDLGELSVIRSHFATDADREKAVDEYFNEVVGTQLNQLREESEAKMASAKKIAKALRFICPSYYIPGKQEWGGY